MRLTNEQKQEIILRYQSGESTPKIARRMNLARATPLAVLKRMGVERRDSGDTNRRYKLNQTFFDVIDTEEKAYVLGFLYGDGCVNFSNGIIGATGPADDKQIYEDMNRACGSDRPARLNKRGYVDWRIHSIKIRNRLFELGVIPNKTKVIEFPHQHLPENLYRHFIRGLFDSDGSLTIYRDRRCHTDRKVACWTIFSTEKMLAFIKRYMRDQEIETNELIHDKRCYANSRILGTSKARSLVKIYSFLYDNATLFLQRKKRRFEEAFRLDSVKNNIGS